MKWLKHTRLEITARTKKSKVLTRLLQAELGKLEKLVDDFLAMSLSRTRCESALRGTPLAELEAELRRCEDGAASALDPERRELARMNRDVLIARRDKLDELRAHVSRLRAQLDLIENTFRLIGDQILTMHSPAELGGQLDELMDGVEAVRSTASEHRQLLGQTS